MGYYAKLGENNVVEQVIAASSDIISKYDGTWVETFIDDPIKQYAGIGMGWTGEDFALQPFPQSTWNGNEWITPYELGIVGDATPIITADGIGFVTVYLIGPLLSQETITINGETTLVTTDGRGYAEIELSSDTAGLMMVEWGGFKLEVAAI